MHAQPILYCIVFYNLLKWSFNEEEHFNWKFILLSIIGTAAYSVLTFYKVFFLFTTRNIVEDLFKLKNNFHKLSFLHKYLIYRGRMMLGIWKYLTLLTFVFSFAAILLFHYFGKFVAGVFQPNHILTSLLIFLFLQLFLDSINYGTYCLPKNQKLGNITRDKIPLYINLLRLEYSPSNRTVPIHSFRCNWNASKVSSSGAVKSKASSPPKPQNRCFTTLIWTSLTSLQALSSRGSSQR